MISTFFSAVSMNTVVKTVGAVALLSIAAMSVGCGHVDTPRIASGEPGVTSDKLPARGMVFDEITVGDKTYPYVVFVPRGYTPEKNWPLIVFLHGSGESGTDGQKQAIQGIGSNILWNAARWPCLVLMPQKPDHTKLWPEYEGAVMGALAKVRGRYSVDANRISITGLSQGGHGAFWFGAKHPEIWCAVAPICGFVDSNRAGDNADTIAKGLRGVPVWAFHGEADDVVPIGQSKKVIDAMTHMAATPAPKFTSYPGVNHGSWDKAYSESELPAFLMQSRPAAAPR